MFDTSKPDGMMRKVLDTSKLTALGWSPSIELDAVGPVARSTSARDITILTGPPAFFDSISATGSRNTVVLPPKPIGPMPNALASSVIRSSSAASSGSSLRCPTALSSASLALT